MSLLLLDLDGTLIDSLPGVEASIRAAVEEVGGFEMLPELRRQIGPPVREMFSRMYPFAETEAVDRLTHAFRAHYDAVGCLLSTAFPGANAFLYEASQCFGERVLITNKRRVPASRILEHMRWEKIFGTVITPDDWPRGVGSKAEAASAMVESRGWRGRAAVFVGDGKDDLEAAKAVRCRFVLAGWGYGTQTVKDLQREVAVAADFDNLKTLLHAQTP